MVKWRGDDSIRELKLNPSSNGYLRAVLYVAPGKKHHCMVHRLVAEAFLAPKPKMAKGRPHLRHLNGDPLDNRASNLAWGSAWDNCQDTVRHGRSTRGEKDAMAKLTEGDVRQIRSMLKVGLTQQFIGDCFGVSLSLIGLIHRQERWAWLK